MTLKEKLDAAWNRPGCLCPTCKVSWRQTCLGWLRWASGTRVGSKKYFWRGPVIHLGPLKEP